MSTSAPHPEPDRATVLHADLDSFYASVEQRDDPSLRGRPVLVGGGVVLAASYEAKARGVRTPMSGRTARALCPDAVVVPPRMEAYSTASKQVFAVFDRTSPIVEGISIDEAFLEVGGLRRTVGDPVSIARTLRAAVASEVGLPITVGIARTKFLAKVASGVAKPDGLLRVDPDHELEFLHPLPVGRLWGVGVVTTATLHDHGIRTVGEVADASEAELVSLLGGHRGSHLHALARGIDPRPVTRRARRRSIGAQHALGRGPHSAGDLDATLVGVTERVCGRMRSSGRHARTVVLRARFADFERVTRSHTLPFATDRTDIVLGAARSLLSSLVSSITDRGITLIGLAVTNFADGHGEQLELALPPVTAPERSALDDALDDLRSRFGTRSVVAGTLLGRREQMSVPTLPDEGRPDGSRSS